MSKLLTLCLLGGFFFFALLRIYAISLEPDQAPQNFRPDLDPNCFNTLDVFLKEVNFKNKQQMTKKS